MIAALVWLSREVMDKDFKDTFFTGQLLPPHLQQLLPRGLARQVEEVVVLQLSEGWRGGMAPAEDVPRGQGTALPQLLTGQLSYTPEVIL